MECLPRGRVQGVSGTVTRDGGGILVSPALKTHTLNAWGWACDETSSWSGREEGKRDPWQLEGGMGEGVQKGRVCQMLAGRSRR